MKLLLITLMSLLCSTGTPKQKKCKVKKAPVKKTVVMHNYADIIINKYMF